MFDAFNRLFRLGKHQHPIDRLARINAMVSDIAIYPQIFKFFMTGHVRGLSLLTYALLTLNSPILDLYAIQPKIDTPVIFVRFESDGGTENCRLHHPFITCTG